MNKAEKSWDERAINFDENAKKFEETSIKMVELTEKHLNSSDSVLDFGCATGTITNVIADKVQKIIGIDISSKMIDIAKRNVGSGNTDSITFEHATIFDESHKKETFNVVLAFNMLHLLEDALKVVQQINMLLKSGGLFISATRSMERNMTSSNVLFDPLSKTEIVPNLELSKFTALENLITNGGFQIIETEDLNGSPECYFIVAKKTK